MLVEVIGNRSIPAHFWLLGVPCTLVEIRRNEMIPAYRQASVSRLWTVSFWPKWSQKNQKAAFCLLPCLDKAYLDAHIYYPVLYVCLFLAWWSWSPASLLASSTQASHRHLAPAQSQKIKAWSARCIWKNRGQSAIHHEREDSCWER